jgi:hypothetical protein
MKTNKPMLEYLANCSKITLESFVLARLNDRANLRKELNEVLDELIEVDIQSRIAEWILVYRQEQAAQPRRERRLHRGPALDIDDPKLPLLPRERPVQSNAPGEQLNEKDPARRTIAPHRVRRLPRSCTRSAVRGLF